MPLETYDLLYYYLPIIGFLITFIAQLFVNGNYKKYKNKRTNKQMTGAEVARKILDNNNLTTITINKISGKLTDHYDPTKKVINLSNEIYDGTSIASVSVAAHECGHAIQDKEKYFFLKVRSLFIPIVNFSTKIGYLAVVIGLIFNALKLAVIGLILLLSMLIFQLITLPVEFNASRRAEKQLKSLSILDLDETKGSKSMLAAAAFTYVASVLATLLQILRLALIINGRNRD